MNAELPTKNALAALVADLHAKGLHDLAMGLTDAVGVLYPPPTPPPSPPPPLTCPNCGSATTNRNAFAGAWRTCVDCACTWDATRRAPCPTCAEKATRGDLLRDSAVAALDAMEARADAAEKRCAETVESLTVLFGRNSSLMDSIRSLIAKLEVCDHGNPTL